jgi:hypothetical protein
MRRSLPLNALRVFEVAARTGSYAEAGVELGLTHGAVSRQIALLEAWLGQRLFVRTGRRMTATPAARVFAAEVSLSFDRVTAAAEACGRPSARQILRVSAPTTLALRWLIPRAVSARRFRRPTSGTSKPSRPSLAGRRTRPRAIPMAVCSSTLAVWAQGTEAETSAGRLSRVHPHCLGPVCPVIAFLSSSINS